MSALTTLTIQEQRYIWQSVECKRKEIKRRTDVKNKCQAQSLDATRDRYWSTVAEVAEVTSREINSDGNSGERDTRKDDNG